MANRSPVCPRNCPARARVFPAGQGRKTGPAGAHSVALAGLHSPGLRVITADDATVALRLLADRRDELGTARAQTVNRLHRLLLELLPGGAKKFLSAAQARELLATVRPRDIAGKTRRRADHRAHAHRQAHQGRRRRAQRAGGRDRQQPAAGARHRPLRRRPAPRRCR